LIADHLNLMGDNPLIGIGAPERRFVEMVDAYDPGLLQLAEEAARKNGRLLKRVTSQRSQDRLMRPRRKQRCCGC